MRGREKRQNAASSREESYSLPSLSDGSRSPKTAGEGGEGRRGVETFFSRKWARGS